MLYFAYGSNMDPVQMRRRCPGSRFQCVARLPGHRLAFPRRSTRRLCGVAGVVADAQAEVWGVVYWMRASDMRRLDAIEGHHPAKKRTSRYARERRMVEADGNPRRPMTVVTYVAKPTRHVPPPSKAYVGHMLRGAHAWGLPADYVATLQAIPTSTR